MAYYGARRSSLVARGVDGVDDHPSRAALGGEADAEEEEVKGDNPSPFFPSSSDPDPSSSLEYPKLSRRSVSISLSVVGARSLVRFRQTTQRETDQHTVNRKMVIPIQLPSFFPHEWLVNCDCCGSVGEDLKRERMRRVRRVVICERC
jgi:hypothetical protein